MKTTARWLVAALFVAGPGPAAAQVEVAGGISGPSHTPSATYTTSYDPPFLYGTHSGEAGQDLRLDGVRGPGVWGSLTWMFARRVGIEARGDFARVLVGGTNEPYEVSLTYQTRQPPDYVLRGYHYRRSTEWPDTDGRIRQLALGGSIVGTLGNPRRLSARLSAGVVLTRLAGSFEPLGFTTFQVGGHGVLFPNEYRLRMIVEPTWTAGFDGGVEVGHALGERVIVVGGVRVRAAPEAHPDVSVAEVTGDTAIQPLTPADAEATLFPRRLDWQPSRVWFFAGLRVRL